MFEFGPQFLGPHAGYIIASYCVSIIVLSALLWQSIGRYKATKRKLDAAQVLNFEEANNV